MNRYEIAIQLNEIIKSQTIALGNLLQSLEEQHSYIVKNDVFNMEAVIEKIQDCNKQVASIEINRRQITKGLLNDKTLSKLIDELDNKELGESFRELRNILEEVRLQKETNDILIKQSLSFTNRMLMILNPDRQAKTYNGYGKIGR